MTLVFKSTVNLFMLKNGKYMLLGIGCSRKTDSVKKE